MAFECIKTQDALGLTLVYNLKDRRDFEFNN